MVWSQLPKMHFATSHDGRHIMPSQMSHDFKSALIWLLFTGMGLVFRCVTSWVISWYTTFHLYCYLANLKKSPSMLVGTVCISVYLFVFWFVCEQSSGHNFNPISMKFFTHISNGHISIPSTFEGQRSNIKVKVTVFVIFRFLLITSSVFVLETSN